MGERKVLNKYIPPDFDPSKIPRGKKKEGRVNNAMKVRMMLPMTVCCNTCGNFIVKGTKFNSRKEDAVGEEYLGLQIFRFFFRCNRCSQEISMKTDPKNSDYVVESGASRNFEPWREKDALEQEADEEREAEEEGDAMKALENRTAESKREMDIMAALDEMRSLSNRQAKVSSADALSAIHAKLDAERVAAEEAEEAKARAVFEEAQRASAGFVRRLESSSDDSDEDGKGKGRKGSGGGANKKPKTATAATGLFGGVFGGASAVAAKPKPKMVVVKAKLKPKPAAAPAAEEKKEDSDSGGGGGALAGLLGAYGSESPS
jgi:hypothetical protein